MDVLILAGGRTEPELKESTGCEFRADLPFGDRTILQIVLDATGYLGEPILVTAHPREGTRDVQSGASFVESLSAGVHRIESENFLLVTADLPFITRAAIEDFLARADSSILINYPVITMQLCTEKYPELPRTAWKFREGEFTGGNIAVMNTAMMRNALPLIEQAYQNRKKVLKLGAQIGPSTVALLAFSRLAPKLVSIHALEKKVGKFLGGEVRAVPTEYAEIGTDIDNAEQYGIALRSVQG